MKSNKKHAIEVRKYLPGQTLYGNEKIGKITGDFGKYDVIETIERKITVDQIGNFSPHFCTYKKEEELVHSDHGDLSDPFRAEESYLKKLFISL